MSQTVVGNLAVELGISDAQLKAGLAQAMTQAQQAGQKMSQALSGNGSAGKGAMGGFALNFSRMIDDAQYGFRGIVNNMEQIGMTAAQSFGASTANAMAFGAALTLSAVALNNLIPQLEKMADTRSELDKLSTSPAAFANSITMATRGIAAMQKEAASLLSKDATSGMGAFFKNQISYLAEWNDKVAGAKTLFSGLMRVSGLAQTRDQQINENRDAGRMANRMMIDSKISSVAVAAAETAFNRGLEEIGKGRITGATPVGEDQKAAFASAMTKPGAAEMARIEMSKDLMNMGVNADEAEKTAIRTIGEAAAGVKESFKTLNLMAPSLNLRGELDKITGKRESNLRFGQYEDAVKQQDSLFARRSAIELQRGRSEILGGMSDVFSRNLNAGQEDPQLKELQEINEGIKNLATLTGLG